MNMSSRCTDAHVHTQCTYLCNSLQAHIVAFALALSQFLQCHSHLSDEFIPPESVHVTYTQPAYTNTNAHRGEAGESVQHTASDSQYSNMIKTPPIYNKKMLINKTSVTLETTTHHRRK